MTWVIGPTYLAAAASSSGTRRTSHLFAVRTVCVADFSMPFDPVYHDDEPTREEVDKTAGPVLLEFVQAGAATVKCSQPRWKRCSRSTRRCSTCRIADGRGKRLGRSFRVKLWPTLIFLRDGKVIVQLVRPASEEARQAMEQL